MEFPVQVNGIRWADPSSPVIREKGFLTKCGDMVAVRPCAEEYENKTFLGILLGDVALNVNVSWDEEKSELVLDRGHYNPIIFIPDRNAIVYGCGSWWGRIKSEEQLKQITDEDIQNIWYVKALQQLAKDEDESNQEA